MKARSERRRARRAAAVLLSLLALPCLLAFQADAGLWPLNLLGAAYAWWYATNIGKRFSNYIDDHSDTMSDENA